LFGNVPYGVNIQQCNTPGKVALTFDDGPYLYTTSILDTLKAAGIKATFFITANNGGKGEIDNPSTGFPAIIQRMYSEGHQNGSQTYSHQDLAAATHEQRLDQIIKNEIALTNILGFFPTYLRTPYVSCNQGCFDDLKALGYHVVSPYLNNHCKLFASTNNLPGLLQCRHPRLGR
jgi:peptidoglycan/xylan/chitin deacetylase (PgdA/CDA1 family)